MNVFVTVLHTSSSYSKLSFIQGVVKPSLKGWIGRGKTRWNLGEGCDLGRPQGFGVGQCRELEPGRFGNTGSGRLGEKKEREVHLGLHNHLDQIGGLGSWTWLFKGDNPDGWIHKAKRFFNSYTLSKDERLEAAVAAFDSELIFFIFRLLRKIDALLSFQWENG